MPASFDPNDLVAMPRLDANGALELGASILACARAESRLPSTVLHGFEELLAEHRNLESILEERLGPPPPDGYRARRADVLEDNHWAALHDWLLAWTRLPLTIPESFTARRLFEALFPEGLAFTQLPYKLEWQEAEDRLKRIERDGLEREIANLGGAVFLRALREAHVAYTEALGMGSFRPAPPRYEIPKKKSLEATVAALRRYVLRVLGQVDEAEPDTAALAERLLKPLRDWNARPIPTGSTVMPPRA
jgi:hypothetical protein